MTSTTMMTKLSLTTATVIAPIALNAAGDIEDDEEEEEDDSDKEIALSNIDEAVTLNPLGEDFNEPEEPELSEAEEDSADF